MKNQNTKPLVIGFAGATGSGKSTLAERVCARVEEKLGKGTVGNISADWYYRDLAHLSKEDRAKVNFDHPDALALDELAVDIRRLSSGHQVEVPQYNFATHTRDLSVTLEPRQILSVDGILIFWPEQLRRVFDLRYFVDVDLDECLARRILRDIKERGRTVESVISQWKATVKPGFLSFVEPTKRYADIIVPHGGENEAAIEAITAQILARVNS